MCLDDFGNIAIEVRRDTYTIKCDECKVWPPNAPNRHYHIDTIDDMIAALQDARRYIHDTRDTPPESEANDE